MSTPRRLTAVPDPRKRDDDWMCRVAAQAVMEGTQDVRVQALTPLAGPGHGQIAVRVGRVLVWQVVPWPGGSSAPSGRPAQARATHKRSPLARLHLAARMLRKDEAAAIVAQSLSRQVSRGA